MRLLLFATAFHSLWTAAFGRLQYGVSAPQDSSALILGTVAEQLSADLASAGLSDFLPASLLFVAIVCGGIVSLAFVLIGKARIGQLVLVIPTAAVSAFLSILGLLSIRAALQVASGVQFVVVVPETWYPGFFSPSSIAQVGAAVGTCVCLQYVPPLLRRCYPSPTLDKLWDPIVLGAALGLFWLVVGVLLLTGSLDKLSSIADSPPTNGGWLYESTRKLGFTAHWRVLFEPMSLNATGSPFDANRGINGSAKGGINGSASGGANGGWLLDVNETAWMDAAWASMIEGAGVREETFWTAKGGQAVTSSLQAVATAIGPLLLVSVLDELLNLLAIGAAFPTHPLGAPNAREPVDVDHEVVAQGAGSLLCSLAGGTLSYHQLSHSVNNRRRGGTHRLSLSVIGGVSALIFLADLPLADGVPKFFQAAVFLDIGYAFLSDWLFAKWALMPALSRVSVCAMIGLWALFDYLLPEYALLLAVAIGVLFTAAHFLVTSARFKVVFARLDGQRLRSTVWRPPYVEAAIARPEMGRQIQIFLLQGALFFGNCTELRQLPLAPNSHDGALTDGALAVGALAGDALAGDARASVIILDFHRVCLLDISAADVLRQAVLDAHNRGVHIQFSRMRPQLHASFAEAVVGGVVHSPSTTLDAALAEAETYLLTQLASAAAPSICVCVTEPPAQTPVGASAQEGAQEGVPEGVLQGVPQGVPQGAPATTPTVVSPEALAPPSVVHAPADPLGRWMRFAAEQSQTTTRVRPPDGLLAMAAGLTEDALERWMAAAQAIELPAHRPWTVPPGSVVLVSEGEVHEEAMVQGRRCGGQSRAGGQPKCDASDATRPMCDDIDTPKEARLDLGRRSPNCCRSLLPASHSAIVQGVASVEPSLSYGAGALLTSVALSEHVTLNKSMEDEAQLSVVAACHGATLLLVRLHPAMPHREMFASLQVTALVHRMRRLKQRFNILELVA